MLKKVDIGKTKFADLHQLFKFKSHEEFEKKKARLFPVGNTINEIPTVAIFLASLSAVKEYREELFNNIDVKKISLNNVAVHAYTELLDDKKVDRPDGLIVITTGKHEPIIEWIGYIEAKVGSNQVDEKQIERYITNARSLGIRNIITISNSLATNPKQNLVAEKLKSKLKNFGLYHWSWTYLKVTASRLIRNNSLADEDHAFILSELRRYFDSHKKLTNFVNMGKQWKDIAKRINSIHLTSPVDNKTLENAVTKYQQEEKDISLQLTDRTDVLVELIHKDMRFDELKKELADKRVMSSRFMLDRDKNKSFLLEVDFNQLQVRCSVEVCIDTGKAKAQTTKLITMLESDSGVPDSLLITAKYPYNKIKKRSEETPLSRLLIEKIEKVAEYSINDKEIGDTVKCFEIKTRDIINRNFFSAKNFIKKLEDNAEVFLSQVMVNLK